jgi:predicted ester cyclase
MNKLALAALVLSTSSGCFNGCQKKKEAEAIEPPPPATTQPEAPAKPLGGDELAQRAIACWGYFNDAKWDDFKGCYAPTVVYDEPASKAIGFDKPLTSPDAIVDSNRKAKVGFPDLKGDVRLALVHGHDVVVVAANGGTHTGPIDGVTAMNQKIADLVANVDVMDDQGRETHESDYSDSATERYQLTPDKTHPVRSAAADVPKATVVAKNDDAEKANVAVVQSLIDAFNKHDAKAMGSAMADDLVWSEQENPKDWTKAETLADAQSGWRVFSDMKMTASAIWGAGDYVVLQATMEGTNDGASPEMGIKAATKKKVALPFLEIDQLAHGKIAKAWVIADSQVVPLELGLIPMPGQGSGSAATGSASK